MTGILHCRGELISPAYFVMVEKVEKRNFGMHAIFPAALRDIQVKGQQ